MRIAILITLILMVFVAILGIALFFLIRRADPHSRDRTENPGIRTAQEFLPFEDIREDMIVLGQHRYRAVLACTSTNYYLKTAGEKDQIELSFQRFLNSISFPITFFLQTRVIDNSARLNALKGEVEKIVSDFPSIAEYAEQYLDDMEHINTKLGNNQQKKRYIIVTYDSADELNQLTEEEKVIHAAREIRHRCQLLQSTLETVGVSSRIMTTAELIELVYSCYWREDYSYAEEIAKGDCFSLFVEGTEDRFHDMPPTKLLDLLLGETINRIQTGNLDAEPSGQEVLHSLQELRRKWAPPEEKGAAC